VPITILPGTQELRDVMLIFRSARDLFPPAW
jgi:hypothetical protein